MVQAEEKRVYMVGKSFMQHKVKPDEDEEAAGSEDSDQESLSSKEI